MSKENKVRNSFSRRVIARFMTAEQLADFEATYEKHRKQGFGGGFRMTPTASDFEIVRAFQSGTPIAHLARQTGKTEGKIRSLLVAALAASELVVPKNQ